MAVKFFQNDFRFDKYIQERLLEISDEGERRELKELMRETLIPFYEHVEEAYRETEGRLEQSGQHVGERYEIITGICERNRVDITEEDMFPMCYGDLHEQLVDIEKMQEALSKGETFPVMKIFMKADYRVIRQIEQENRAFHGTIYTEDGEYGASFRLVKNKEYENQIAELYPVFIENGIPWKTVCAPYLNKFFCVEVVQTEYAMDCDIQKILVDFEEYSQWVDYNLIPMWNVRIMEEKTSAYPELSVDRIHYEHCIYKGRMNEMRDYLVDGNGTKVWDMQRIDGDLHILSGEKNPVRWKLIELGYDAIGSSYDFPIFRNGQKKRHSGRCIHTYAEVEKFITELGYGAYLKLNKIEKTKQKRNSAETAYSMDAFIEDEIRTEHGGGEMHFFFETVNGIDYLNLDILSYLLSCVQRELPEYLCTGELI